MVSMHKGVSVQSLTIRLDQAQPLLLDDQQRIEQGLRGLVKEAGLHPLEAVLHRFAPQGVSVALLLQESHIAIHTWPEQGVAYLTLSTCRPLPSAACQRLVLAAQALCGAKRAIMKDVEL